MPDAVPANAGYPAQRPADSPQPHGMGIGDCRSRQSECVGWIEKVMSARKLTNCIIVAIMVWIKAWRLKPYLFGRRSFSFGGWVPPQRCRHPHRIPAPCCDRGLPSKGRSVERNKHSGVFRTQLSGVDRHPDQRRAIPNANRGNVRRRSAFIGIERHSNYPPACLRALRMPSRRFRFRSEQRWRCSRRRGRC